MVNADEYDEDALLTIPEAAKQLGSSQPTIFRYVRENLLKATEVNGRLMIQESDISRFLGGW